MPWKTVKDDKLKDLKCKPYGDSIHAHTTTELKLTEQIALEGKPYVVTSLKLQADGLTNEKGSHDVYKAICMPIKEVKKSVTK